MWAGIVALLGIVTTLLAWFLNPKRVLSAKLASIDKQLAEWGGKRDEALKNGNVDNLTIATATIAKLMQERAALLQ